MENIQMLYAIIFIFFTGIGGCEENPATPERTSDPFPLVYKFINVSDTTIIGGFDVRLVAYYPETDSSSLVLKGLNSPAVGHQLNKTLDKEGLPGVEMTMVFSAKKVWPEHWPDQDPLYQTKNWFYIERCAAQDSTQATISFVWPQDTARTDVHAFLPDTTDPNFRFWGPEGAHKDC